jgi:hypothetical protein
VADINSNLPVNDTSDGTPGSAAPSITQQVGGTDGTNLRTISTDTSGRVNIGAIATTVVTQGISGGVPVQTLPLAPVSTSSYPNPMSAYPLANAAGFKSDYNLTLDVFDNLQVRGPVLTDEGSFRDDFSGTSLYTALTGNVKFASNSTQVTGTGTIFTQEVSSGFYMKSAADAETAAVQIAYVQDDTDLFLTGNYSANENNVAAVISRWKVTTAAVGGTTSVASSILSLSSGTASGGISSIQNVGDYLPYVFQAYCSISQRIANQTTVVGFQDSPSSPTKRACVVFDGTVNTTVKFVTSSSSAAADTQTTTVTLPNGATTNNFNTYEINLVPDGATLLVNGQVVATNSLHLPGPYDTLTASASMSNSAVVTTTTLSIDYILFNNTDRLNITNDYPGDPPAVAVQGTYNISLPTAAATGQRVPIQTDINGRQLVVNSPIDGQRASYSMSATVTTAATATDVVTITGSATKTVRVTLIRVSGLATTAITTPVLLIKRSAANTGGTSAALTAVPHDSNNAAATATGLSYTANPTGLGAAVGTMRQDRLTFAVTASTADAPLVWDFGARPSQAVVLRGTTQVLAVNLNSTTITGGSISIDIEWTEE